MNYPLRHDFSISWTKAAGKEWIYVTCGGDDADGVRPPSLHNSSEVGNIISGWSEISDFIRARAVWYIIFNGLPPPAGVYNLQDKALNISFRAVPWKSETLGCNVRHEQTADGWSNIYRRKDWNHITVCTVQVVRGARYLRTSQGIVGKRLNVRSQVFNCYALRWSILETLKSKII